MRAQCPPRYALALGFFSPLYGQLYIWAPAFLGPPLSGPSLQLTEASCPVGVWLC